MLKNYIKRFIVALLIVHADIACGVDIFEAAQKGHVQEVARILQANPDAVAEINYFSRTPLHVAVQQGHVQV